MTMFMIDAKNEKDPYDRNFTGYGYFWREAETKEEAARIIFAEYRTATMAKVVEADWTTFRPSIVATEEVEEET